MVMMTVKTKKMSQVALENFGNIRIKTIVVINKNTISYEYLTHVLINRFPPVFFEAVAD